MKSIILVGIMGCGKTTISKLLSEKLVGETQDNGSNIVDEFPLETLKSILGSFYTNRKD